MSDKKYEIENNGNIISVAAKELPFRRGLGSVVFEKMSEYKEAVGQIDGINGEKDTYESMLRRSVRTAMAMRSKGITRDDIVTVCSFNHLDTNIPIIASLFLGVKTACTDPSLSLTDTVYLLNLVRPKMIFVSPDSVELIEDALQEIGITSELVVFGDTTKHSKFSEFLKEVPGEKDFVPVEVEDIKETAAIFFSSGTTGMPKGICLPHLSFLAQIPNRSEMNIFSKMASLTYSPPYWLSSLVLLINTIVTGGCRVVLPTFDANDLWRVLETHQVFMVLLILSQLATICSTGRPKGANTSSLKLVVSGGNTIPTEKIEEIRKIFPETLLLISYGQTELGGGGINFNLAENPEDIRFLFEKPASSGKPRAGFSFKVVDPETEEILGVNQKGELRVKTEYQMNGYYNVDSMDRWDSEGFLKTGDIVYYDEDYCFYIVDRLKEMLKFRSWTIAPAKLEAVLLTHPAVESAMVLGLPHPIDGDHPMGIVVLRPGCSATSEEIEKYIEGKVGDRERLRGGVKILESFPITPSGKFKRKYMKDLMLQGKL